MFISPLDLNFFEIAVKIVSKTHRLQRCKFLKYMKSATETIKNPYQSIYENSQPGTKIGQNIQLGGVNYGKKWNEQDAALYETFMASLGFQNELALMDYQNEYNSPEAQVRRMRAAGLNPDLQGIENYGSASAASPDVVTPNGTASPDTLDILQMTGSFLSSAQSAMQSALSSYTGLMQSLNQMDKQELDLTKDQMSLARELWKMYGGAENKENPSVLQASIRGFRFGSKRGQKRWNRLVNVFYNDLETGTAPDYKTRGDAVGDEVAYNVNRVKRVSGVLTSDELETDLAGTFASIRHIVKGTFRFQKMFDNYLYQNKMNYQYQYSGTDAAKADMEIKRHEGNMAFFRNNNIDGYFTADYAKTQADIAISEYRAAYDKAMNDLLTKYGVVGMTAAIEFAKQNPFSEILSQVVGETAFGNYDDSKFVTLF